MTDVLNITVLDAAAQLQSGTPPLLLDVRTADEVARCTLPQARHIPLAALPERHAELPTDQPIIVYCHHGGRSARAVAWLQAAGYQHVVNLSGGIDAWAAQLDPLMQRY
jgi:rhodanese-related sulfurtransferase